MEHLRARKSAHVCEFSEVGRQGLKTSQRAYGAGGHCHIGF